MFQKIFGRKTGAADFNKNQQEYDQYCRDLERTLSALEAALHVSDDPEEIAMMAMKTACAFYQADWAGFLEVDMDLGLWSPAWWYNTSPNDQTMAYLNEFESAEFLHRWVVAMRENKAVIVPKVEELKTEWPEEYAVLKRMDAESIIGVPVKPRPTGFLVIRNPKRYLEHSSMLQMLAFVVLTNFNEKKLLDSAKMALSPEAIESDKDIIINFLGSMEIITSKGVLREQDFKAPKSSRVVTYLLLHRRATHPPLEIASALWPNDNADPDTISGNIRGQIYRFRQAFSLISDYQLVESTPNGYRINPELRIMTDLQQFDKMWESISYATATSKKVDLMKQAVEIYRGPLFENASDEHWITSMVNNYNLKYVGLINELLLKLAEAEDYSGVQKYAAQSLEIVPGNVKARYWLIYATYHLGTVELARTEIERSRRDLTTEEYTLLVKHLRNNKTIPSDRLFSD